MCFAMPLKLMLAAAACIIALVAIALGVTAVFTLTPLVAALLLILVWFSDSGGEQKQQISSDNQDHTTTGALDFLPAMATLIDALELPVVVLDDALDVRSHNRAAREIFPQLRVGGSLSPAVRNPELLDAARDALNSNSSRSVQIVN